MATIDSYPKEVQELWKKMILDEETWIQWPYLPLKRPGAPGDFPQLGVITSKFLIGGNTIVAGQPIEVELRSMFENKTLLTITVSYPTVDELFADNWVID